MSGDLPPDALRARGAAALERIARYLEDIERRPVLARTRPGEVIAKLPPHPPDGPEPWEAIERDLTELIEPNLTNWQHPGYLAYFATTASVPGIVGDVLAAGYNQIGILWRTSPVLTELEQVMVRWLAELVGLPEDFDGQLPDTASTATLLALVTARDQTFPELRNAGWAGLPPGVVYASQHVHSSIDKACVVLGLGTNGLRKIAVDAAFRMDPAALASAIAEDRAAGRRPVAVVATIGTTSVASVDPVSAIADICEREGVFLHVDAAYAGPTAMLPEKRPLFSGWERADSVVFNPHKWMFVPQECTALFFRKMDRVRRALSVVPEYLTTPEGRAGAREYMDYNIQLGRRFRALKLWITLRTFGREGMRARLAAHLELARRLEAVLSREPDVELAAPVHFSLVTFRWAPEGLSPEETDAANHRILARVNAEGRSFISHTAVNGRVILRVAIGSLRTEWRHLETLLESLRSAIAAEAALAPAGNPLPAAP